MRFTADRAARSGAGPRTLDALCDAAAAMTLSADEARHPRPSAGVKLTEMADYRPCEADPSDCLFLGTAYRRSLPFPRGADGRLVRRMCSGTAARLAAKGNWQPARAMLPRRLRPSFHARVAARKLVPPATHRPPRGRVAFPVLALLRRV